MSSHAKLDPDGLPDAKRLSGPPWASVSPLEKGGVSRPCPGGVVGPAGELLPAILGGYADQREAQPPLERDPDSFCGDACAAQEALARARGSHRPAPARPPVWVRTGPSSSPSCILGRIHLQHGPHDVGLGSYPPPPLRQGLSSRLSEPPFFICSWHSAPGQRWALTGPVSLNPHKQLYREALNFSSLGWGNRHPQAGKYWAHGGEPGSCAQSPPPPCWQQELAHSRARGA